MGITPREIEDRLEDAAWPLRRLPHPAGSGPRGYGSSWPPYVQEARHAYGYHAARMLLFVRDPDDRRIVWMRAEGVRWREICIFAGCVRSTAHQRWAAALLPIAKHLNRTKKPPVR